ncbi:MurR/RpiR family transcriptional regulator [Ligilactobacillus ceti]|nr:MurR/RpiR family transcriptional regulator [Ligilactobacillus ceti]
MTDFYEITSKNTNSLSKTEQNIFNYVVKNMHKVKNMSIRELSTECYVSTTTVFRFVKKIGYSGYEEFVNSVREAEEATRKINIPNIVKHENYKESYLKNIIEGVQVLTDDKIDQFNAIMSKYPKVYILVEGASREVAHYFYRLLVSVGYSVDMLFEEFEIDSILKRIKSNDVLLVLSYTGSNQRVINSLERIFAIVTPTIVSFTRADNNIIQNMSDLNFYVFADEVNYEGIDVTSRIGMIAIIEILMYKRIIN